LVFDPYASAQPEFFGMTWEELWNEKHPTAWVDFELGKLTEAEYLLNFFADGRDFDHSGLKETMRVSYRWLEGMEELLSDLSDRGFEIHAFSNYPIWYRMIEERFGLSRFLRWSFVSCRTGVRKPDERGYQQAARTLGRLPQDCLFVDDRAPNCAGAAAVGMDAVLFSGAPTLRADLEHRGLL